MAKNKQPELPSTPQYQQDSQFRQALGDLTNVGTRLSNLDFSGGWNPSLAETTQFNPEMLQTFMDTLKTKLTPQFNDSVTNLRNELAATGALESSTASNSQSRLASDFLNTLQVQAGDYGLQGMMKALENRITLTNMGLNALGQGTAMGQANEQNLNQFNLSNYENQVAAQMYKDQNSQGGWAGALKGGLGGAGIGAAIGGGLAIAGAPFTGGASLALLPAIAAGAGTGALVGGGAGYFLPSSSGENLFRGGISAASTMAVPRYIPSSSAVNNVRDMNVTSSDLFAKMNDVSNYYNPLRK